MGHHPAALPPGWGNHRQQVVGLAERALLPVASLMMGQHSCLVGRELPGCTCALGIGFLVSPRNPIV